MPWESTLLSEQKSKPGKACNIENVKVKLFNDKPIPQPQPP